MRYCPYLGTDTDDKFSKEHIIPEAIGERLDYSIDVSGTINSQFGDTIDAALVNLPPIRALCIAHEVKGKGGLPTLKVTGRPRHLAYSIALRLLTQQ